MPAPQEGLARPTLLAAAADAATALSTLALSIVIARGLGPTNRGIYFLAVLAATLIALVGNLGTPTAAIVYGASRRVPLTQLHGLAVLFSLAVGAIGTALLLGLEHVLTDSVLRGVDLATLVLVGLSLAPLVYAAIVGALLTGMGHVPAISVLRIALAVVTPVITVPAVVLGGGRPVWPVAAWLAGTAALAVAEGWLATRRGAPPARPTRAVTRELLAFSLRGHIGTLAHQGFLRIDALFVSAQLGPRSVGLYSQASVMAERMSTLGHALYSSSAARLGSDPRPAATALATDILRMLILVMVPVAALLMVFSHPIIVVLFGAAFAPAAAPFAILLPGTVCLTLWYVLSLFITSTLRRPGTATIIQGLGFVVSVPLYWLAVERWGINGAAVVSTGTYAAVFTAGVAFFLHSTEVSWLRLVPRASDLRQMLGLVRQGLATLPGVRPRLR